MAFTLPAVRSLVAIASGTVLVALAGCAGPLPAPTETIPEPSATETIAPEPEQPAAGTIEVWNDEGTIGLRVPAAWSETDSSFETDQGWEAGLLAGPDLAAVGSGADVVKVRAIGRATEEPGSYVDTLLAQQVAGGCEIITEDVPYTDGVYTGVAGSARCTGVLASDFIYVVLGFSADDGSSSGYLAMQLAPDSSEDVVNDVVASFIVDFGA